MSGERGQEKGVGELVKERDEGWKKGWKRKGR